MRTPTLRAGWLPACALLLSPLSSALASQIQLLDTVVVTATRRTQPIDDVLAPVQVISREQIYQFAATRPSSSVHVSESAGIV